MSSSRVNMADVDIRSPWVVRLDGHDERGFDIEIVGAKGRGLARLAGLGVPTPPAFAVSSEAIRRSLDGATPDNLVGEVATAIQWIEAGCDRRFGSNSSPLLLSVRSSGAVSMPGLMDTILNVGLPRNDLGLDRVDSARFEEMTRELRERLGSGTSLPAAQEQLEQALELVALSSTSETTRAFRDGRGLESVPVSVIVQAMVFGNAPGLSGTGVAFTRSPITGGPDLFGEWLPSRQGPGLVGGTETPGPLTGLREAAPDVYEALASQLAAIERAEGDMQDVEFTVERGVLWVLQIRPGKRTQLASVVIAVDMLDEGLIDQTAARTRLAGLDANDLAGLVQAVDLGSVVSPVLRGTPACPGMVVGLGVSTAEEVAAVTADGGNAILIRRETVPSDLPLFLQASGVVTGVGGTTSHAAVVSRELGKPCVVGCGTDALHRVLGKQITVDATAGAVYEGDLTIGARGHTDERAADYVARVREILGDN